MENYMANTYLSKAALKMYSPSGRKTHFLQANLTFFPAVFHSSHSASSTIFVKPYLAFLALDAFIYTFLTAGATRILLHDDDDVEISRCT